MRGWVMEVYAVTMTMGTSPPLNEAGEPVPMPSIFDVRPGDRYHVPGRAEPVTVTRVFPPMAGDGGAVVFEDVYVLPVHSDPLPAADEPAVVEG